MRRSPRHLTSSAIPLKRWGLWTRPLRGQSRHYPHSWALVLQPLLSVVAQTQNRFAIFSTPHLKRFGVLVPGEKLVSLEICLAIRRAQGRAPARRRDLRSLEIVSSFGVLACHVRFRFEKARRKKWVQDQQVNPIAHCSLITKQFTANWHAGPHPCVPT